MNSIKNLVRPNILKLNPYSSARDEFSGKKGVFLDANENPYGELNRYPDPYQNALKNKLADFKKVKPSNIFIGNGSDEIIDLAFRIFCSPGYDKALTFSPTYGMYEVSASINNIELIKVPFKEDFQLDLENLKSCFKNPTIKLLFICSPNNPTGNCLAKADIEFVLQNFKGIVIIDEAYIDFAQTNSALELIDKYENLIVSQTFSKAWGLASARVGIAYANEEIISLFNKVKPPYNVSALNQKATIEALDDFESFEQNLKSILKEKERLESEIRKFNYVKKIYPSDANFLLLKVKDANGLYQELVSLNIIIRNRNSILPNCLRITVGTPEENNKLLNALKKLS